ncbi:hypothetical protein J6590_008016 [Homalodisca vitripennis]|nr:hypothetical protein J6590_008016 [Homalodisca vitripennis]
MNFELVLLLVLCKSLEESGSGAVATVTAAGNSAVSDIDRCHRCQSTVASDLCVCSANSWTVERAPSLLDVCLAAHLVKRK